jgi:uncharacterized iron-regulated protein
LRYARVLALLLAISLACCATVPPGYDWESRLRGDTIALLGEVHDNAEHHRLRLEILRRAFAAGWRPAIAMEQLDRERQADINRARVEKPRDAQHVIDRATQTGSTNRGNWNWNFYRPFVALALEYDVPLIAANLSNADISKVVREGYAAVFDAAQVNSLGLNAAVPADLQAAQERAIDIGHCNALPAKVVPAMARGQMARDAVMASIVSQHAARGVVLLAGNGHVRRDNGIARWQNAAAQRRTLAVGFLEASGSPQRDGAFDAVVITAAAQRDDPCIAFKQRMKPQ